MVGQRQGCAEHRHQAIAGNFADDAAVAADRIEHQRVVGVEQLDGVLGSLHFRQWREVPNVGKHHRPAHALAAERKAGLLQLLRHFRCCETAHKLLLLITQPLLLQARADARLEQSRIDRLLQVVLRA